MTEPATARALVTAAHTVRAMDMLDGLIDARPATAAKRITAMPADTARALLLSGVLGVRRTYRVPHAMPDDEWQAEHESLERVRRVVADILDQVPEIVPAVLHAVADATRPTTESETP